MIEIKVETIEQDDYRYKRNQYSSWKLFQNQEEVHGLYVTGSEVQSFIKSTSIMLSEESIYEYPKDYVVILKNLIEEDFWSIGVEIGKNAFGIVGLNINPIQENEYLIKFVMTYDLNNWKERYSFREYREEFTKTLDGRDVFYLDSGNDLQIKDYDDRHDNKIVSIAFHHFTDNSIYTDIQEYLEFLQHLHLEAIKNIQPIINENIVGFTFNFPEELKVFCNQYLLYFAQFLQDLGIDATSNLTEEAGKVLFSVTPTDDIEALDKIREALAVYLSLPSSPIIYEDDKSFAAIRMQQQIDNLQHSQKMTARELQITEKLIVAQSDLIREKNLSISQKDSTIEQQNKIIEKIMSKSIMIDSLENKEELEKFCEGFEVGHSKWLYELTGIKTNPLTILKNAGKKILGKEVDKSVLGLNEEAEKENNRE